MASAYHAVGDDVYSYAACILTRDDDGFWILNVTKYSPTTSRHQSRAFKNVLGCPDIVKIDGQSRNVTARELRIYVYKQKRKEAKTK